MSQSLNSQVDRSPLDAAPPLTERLTEVAALIDQFDAATATLVPQAAELHHENRLAEARLGLAGALFLAMRSKHLPTASHSLRVALGCSAWAYALEMDETSRDELEIAALLHDIGKLGVPDAILLKPGLLLPDEMGIVDRHRLVGLDILRSCCTSANILEIVRHAPAWFDGSRAGYPLRAQEIPLGSRVLAIVDAFDSMTTDQVYRRAMSHDRAMSELYGGAGNQFDPDLVKVFSVVHDNVDLQTRVARRWLTELDPRSADRLWQWKPAAPATADLPFDVFQQKLLENMHDAVVFVDRTLKITLWNRGAERLTGLARPA